MAPELKMTTAAREWRVRRAAKSVRTTVGYGTRVRKDPRSGSYSLVDLGTGTLIAEDLDLSSLEELVGSGALWNQRLVVPGAETTADLLDVLQATVCSGGSVYVSHGAIDIEPDSIDDLAPLFDEVVAMDGDVGITIRLSGDYQALLQHLQVRYATELKEHAAEQTKFDSEQEGNERPSE